MFQQDGSMFHNRVSAIYVAKSLASRNRAGTAGPKAIMAIVVVGLIAYVTVGGGYQQLRGLWAEDSNETYWEVFVAQSEPLQDIVLDASGYAAPRQRVEIAPQAQGILKVVNVDKGDRVVPGQLLAAIDATTYEAELKRAQGALQAAQARLQEMRGGSDEVDIGLMQVTVKQAKLRLDDAQRKRSQAEAARRAVTDQEFDALVASQHEAEKLLQNAELQLQRVEKGVREEQIAAAEAEVRRAEAAVSTAEHFLRNTKLISPVHALVLSRNGDVGELVLPNVTALVLANIDSTEVLIEVPERDLYLIKVGQPCRIISDAYPDSEYSGQVSLIEPHVDRSRGIVQVRVEVENPDERLLPNMNCRVLCLHDEDATTSDAVWIPSGAVEKIDDELAVYVLTDGKAQRRIIQSDTSAPGAIHVSDGIAVGEKVILPGIGTLKDGMPIQVRTDENESNTKSDVKT